MRHELPTPGQHLAPRALSGSGLSPVSLPVPFEDGAAGRSRSPHLPIAPSMPRRLATRACPRRRALYNFFLTSAHSFARFAFRGNSPLGDSVTTTTSIR